MRKNTVLFFLVCLALIDTGRKPLHVSAAEFPYSKPISTVTRLDITSGRIVGEKAEYTITVPPLWAGYLTAERERSENSQDIAIGIVEKVTFYYEPMDKISKRLFLASFYIQLRNSQMNIPFATKIYETNMYIFWVDSAKTNPCQSDTDTAIYDRFLRDLSDYGVISTFVSTPKTQWRILNNSITVNGTLIEGKTIIKDNGIVYLPLRDVCAALGYTVGWFSYDKVATISGHGKYQVLSTSGNNFLQRFTAYMEGEKCYVSSLFFVKELNHNLEIDENNNVIISD